MFMSSATAAVYRYPDTHPCESISCYELIYGNLRKPARARRAQTMQLFCAIQRYSTSNLTPMTMRMTSFGVTHLFF